MKEITFDELHKLVAKIDYVDYVYPQSFPVRFKVDNGRIDEVYEAGIGDICDDDDYHDALGGCGQYLANIVRDKYKVLSLIDADAMYFNVIGEILRTECEIVEGSKIYLIEEKSFTGERKDDFSVHDLSPKCISELNDEVEIMKGNQD